MFTVVGAFLSSKPSDAEAPICITFLNYEINISLGKDAGPTTGVAAPIFSNSQKVRRSKKIFTLKDAGRMGKPRALSLHHYHQYNTHGLDTVLTCHSKGADAFVSEVIVIQD